MFTLAPLRQQRVDLVHEDDSRLVHTRHCEQRAHHLLALANLIQKSTLQLKLTIFKLPKIYTHFEVSDDALILKKVDFD